MTKLFLVPLQLMMALGSCSNGDFKDCNLVDQDTIYQSLSIFYEKESDTTLVNARMSEGDVYGSTLNMSNGCSIEHNSVPLSQSTDNEGRRSVSYWKEFPTWVTRNIFTFTNHDGGVFENGVETMNGAEFGTLPTSIASSTDLEVEWLGPPLEEGESVCLEILGNAASFDDVVQISCSSTLGATKVLMPSQKLRKLSPSQAVTLQLKRRREVALRQSTRAGGSLSILYSSKRGDLKLEL